MSALSGIDSGASKGLLQVEATIFSGAGAFTGLW